MSRVLGLQTLATQQPATQRVRREAIRDSHRSSGRLVYVEYAVLSTQRSNNTSSLISLDYMYGVLGVASFGLEIGKDWYEDCGLFEGTIVPNVLPSLMYATMIAKRPFSLVKGPDIIDLSVTTTDVLNVMKITVVASDSQMADGYTTGEQGVAHVQIYLDVHPDDNKDGGVTFDMVPLSKDSQTFDLEMILPQGLASGQHTLFVQATDDGGYDGPVSSKFFNVETTGTTSPTNAPTASSSSSPTNEVNIMSPCFLLNLVVSAAK